MRCGHCELVKSSSAAPTQDVFEKQEKRINELAATMDAMNTKKRDAIMAALGWLFAGPEPRGDRTTATQQWREWLRWCFSVPMCHRELLQVHPNWQAVTSWPLVSRVSRIAVLGVPSALQWVSDQDLSAASTFLAQARRSIYHCDRAHTESIVDSGLLSAVSLAHCDEKALFLGRLCNGPALSQKHWYRQLKEAHEVDFCSTSGAVAW